MIIPNSTITPVVYSSTLDENGLSTEGTRTEGKAIQAQCVTMLHNELAVAGGEPYTAASYQILIEWQNFPYTRLMLQREGEAPREFGVIKVESLRAVSQIAVYV